MADNLPDPKLKAKLFRHGSSCVLAEIGYTLSSCEQWEEMFKQDKKSKNRQQKFKQHVEQTKAMLQPIDELIQAYLVGQKSG